MRTCIGCGETDSSKFYVDKVGRLFSRCKPCRKVYACNKNKTNRADMTRRTAEWRLNNPLMAKNNAIKWALANPDKIKLRYIKSKPTRDTLRHKRRVIIKENFDVKAVQNAFALSKIGDKYLDAYTGHLIDAPTIEHIVPLSKGGTHEVDNLCVTSFSNNSSKKAKIMIIWMAQQRVKELSYESG